MITYVNTVLVSSKNTAVKTALTGLQPGNIVFENVDATDAAKRYTVTGTTEDRIRVGVVTNQKTFGSVNKETGEVSEIPVIKWSNVITRDSVKSFNQGTYDDNTQDTITIAFPADGQDIANFFKLGNKRIVIRIQYKDLPTRYRKWSETYEYVTKEGENMASIVKNIAIQINSQHKRARIKASAATTNLTLTALEYTDDNRVDTLNWNETVRFTANVWYTDPTAAAFASKNKYFIPGLEITKTPGKIYQAYSKLVRDRESIAMGYEGILNRGEGTFPIIKPDMMTDLDVHYDYATLEFETMYRSADDLFRKTKQCVELYGTTAQLAGATAILKAFAEPKAAADEGGE